MSKSIERLVFCSKNESYLDLLEILFVNSQKIPRLKAGFYQDLYFLIDVVGDNPEGRRTMETGILQWKEFLERHGTIKFDEETKEEAKKIVDSLFVKGNLTFEDLSSYPWLHTPIQKKGIVSSLLKKALYEYERESKLLKRLIKEKNLIGLLSDKDVSIIEMWAQIGICYVCKTFELISTTQGSRPKTCPYCNQQNLTATIFGFDEDFQKHFTNNKVLPIFCVEYINDKLKKQVAKPQKIKDCDGNDVGDIDIYIEPTSTAIECKLALDHDPSDHQFGNHYTEILDDLKKYVNFGVKNLIVVTNIEEHRAKVLEEQLIKELQLSQEISLKVVHRSVTMLLETLSKEADSVKISL